MEIPEIKSRLPLLSLVRHYGHSPNRNKLIKCPFHTDKTASLQLYPQTNTWYCFGCGKGRDVIDFIQLAEHCNTHQALKKATSLIGLPAEPTTLTASTPLKPLAPKPIPTGNYNELMKTLQENTKKNEQAKAYIKSRALDLRKLEIGYNCGTISVLKYCIVFGLKDKFNTIVSLYGRSIYNNNDKKHFYLTNRNGLYPGYPDRNKTDLILTESIIDAASLLQIPEVRANYSVIACFGTNGLNEEIKSAIREWGQDRNGLEIIFAYDNDEAGNTATTKYTEELRELVPGAIVTKLNLLHKDVNQTIQAYGQGIAGYLLNTKSYLSPLFLCIANI